MPFYEYECIKCNHQTEVLQKMSDPPLKKCGQCNGRLKKLISQSTFHLKGSGWYVTDYASKSGEKDEKSSSDDTSTDKSKDSATKETKSSSSDTTTKKTETKTKAKTTKKKD